ncbi:MAG TPA: hypothetical protein VK149_04235 [Sideroxyarcus sp.]|nr:hypothetical protein [Sideroxyarcus sp.]
MNTPATVIAELREIRRESAKGIQSLYEAEAKFAELDRAADVEEAKALIAAQGTVVDRQAVAKIATADARLAADIAKAEWNRVKAKIRLLEQQQMSVQTEARLLELEWRG